jgi:hypothetical protein
MKTRIFVRAEIQTQRPRVRGGAPLVGHAAIVSPGAARYTVTVWNARGDKVRHRHQTLATVREIVKLARYVSPGIRESLPEGIVI